MEINYSPKKVWNDLIDSKENIRHLIYIALICLVFDIIAESFNLKFLSGVSSMLLGSYFILMINNIIQDKQPILEDLGKNDKPERDLITIIFKVLGIGIIYGLPTGIAAAFLLFFLLKILSINVILASVILFIILIPMIILIGFSNLLFAENLKFKEAFNIKKSILCFKSAWKKYITVFLIYIMVILLVFCLLFVFLLPITFLLDMLLKLNTTANLTTETVKLTGNFLGIIFGTFGQFIVAYWYTNAIAQIYKYSLEKIEQHK